MLDALEQDVGRLLAECDLNYVPNKAVEVNVTMAASNSLGFGGHNACVVLKKV